MDVFALLFILSFIALLVTLVVMSIRKRITFSRLIDKGKGDFKEEVETIVENTYFETTSDFSNKFDFESSIDKWQKSLPHPSTRLKNRNKRKGHSKGVRGKKK